MYADAWGALRWLEHTVAQPDAWCASVYDPGIMQQWARVLRLAAEEGREVFITSLGGSSSAVRINHAAHTAAALKLLLQKQGRHGGDVNVTHVGASQGSTHTEWGAWHMDALVPSRTDILVWEYALNDDIPAWSTAAAPLQQRQHALEFFVARARAINPRIVLVFLFLWQNTAAKCWPRCDTTAANNRSAWRATAEAVAALRGEGDVFALDFGWLARAMPKRSIFADYHHPTPSAHVAMAGALLARLGAPLHSGAASLRRTCATAPPAPLGGVARGPSPLLEAGELTPEAQALAKVMLGPRYVFRALTYVHPHPGDSMALGWVRELEPAEVHSLGKEDPLRLDRKRFMVLPPCGGNRTADYAVRFAPGEHRALTHVGLFQAHVGHDPLCTARWHGSATLPMPRVVVAHVELPPLDAARFASNLSVLWRGGMVTHLYSHQDAASYVDPKLLARSAGKGRGTRPPPAAQGEEPQGVTLMSATEAGRAKATARHDSHDEVQISLCAPEGAPRCLQSIVAVLERRANTE